MWVGRSIVNPTDVLPATELLVRIMVIGLACRAVSDGWMKLFYGAGHIRKYAPYVFAGGLFNPILSILLILVLPKSVSFTGAAIAYSVVFFVVHMIIMPQVTANDVGLTLGKILKPAVRPLVISVAVSPALFVAGYFLKSDLINWTGVLVGVSTYGITYAIASWWFLLSRSERKEVNRLLRQAFHRQSVAP
jgi:hypothetical protein